MLSQQERFGLSDEEIVSQAAMMLVAGQITTTDQLCHNLFTLLTTAGIVEKLQKQPQHLRTALEEFNRLDPAVTFLFRIAKRDLVLEGQALPKGAVLFISTHAVNRDPSVFDHPNECDLYRRQNPHMAYGFGPHICLGAKLARIQMERCFGEMLRRFPRLSLDSDNPSKRKHESLAFSGFHHLPLKIN